jgi:hypothetical protein
MAQQVQERIARYLRLELERVEGLSAPEIEAVMSAFTVLETSSPRTGHVQYRLMHLGPEIEQRSDIANAISRAIHAAGYYLAGEE